MKLQDLFPYDPTRFGLEGIYEPIGTDSFLIESKCIMVADQIVTTGDTYFLIERDVFKNLSATFVDLIDCFYFQGLVYVLVFDTIKEEVKLLNHKLQNELARCQWKLVDTFTVEHMIDKKHGR